MRTTFTRSEFFRAALFVPFAVPLLALVLLGLVPFRSLLTVDWVKHVQEYLGLLIVSVLWYGLPYGALIAAIWSRSRRWTVRQFGLLLGGTPLVLALACLIVVSIGLSMRAAIEFFYLALVVGYSHVLLIAMVALVGHVVGWIGDPGVEGVSSESRARVA